MFLGPRASIGHHAPGLRLGCKELLRACQHALFADGMALQVIRSNCHKPAHIGWAPGGVAACPATMSAPDIEGAQNEMFSISKTLY